MIRGSILALAFALAGAASASLAASGCAGSDANSDGSAPATIYDAGPCTVTAPTECPNPPVTFTDVLPLIQAKCGYCHTGATLDSPWPLDNYDHIAEWADTLRGNVLECTMPPPDASVPVSNDDRTKILTWIACKTPR